MTQDSRLHGPTQATFTASTNSSEFAFNKFASLAVYLPATFSTTTITVQHYTPDGWADIHKGGVALTDNVTVGKTNILSYNLYGAPGRLRLVSDSIETGTVTLYMTS